MKIAALRFDIILRLGIFFVVRVLGQFQVTKFKSLKCNDVAVCATSTPEMSFPAQSPIQCGLKCQTKVNVPQTCIGVNYREQNKVCEIFSANSTSFARNVKGCQYMQKGEIDKSLTTIACDINECLANNGGCSSNAICNNNPGSFSCVCGPGYVGNGFSCAVIDRCQPNNGGCSSNAVCNNNPASSLCTCATGYTGNGVLCSDINECAINNGGCDANVCINTIGSSYCQCSYTGVACGVRCSMASPHNFTSYNATFTSLNYPSNYDHKLDCHWLIIASSPYTVVKLSFGAFCTEACCDYVRIYDGSNSSSTLLMSASGCSELPGPVTTTQRYMFVSFTSDHSLNNYGFNATYNLQ